MAADGVRLVGAAVAGAAAPRRDDPPPAHEGDEDGMQVRLLDVLDRMQAPFEVAFLCFRDRDVMVVEQWSRPILSVVLIGSAFFGYATGNYALAGCATGVFVGFLPSLYLMRRNHNILETMDQVRELEEGNADLRANIIRSQAAIREANQLAEELREAGVAREAELERFRGQNELLEANAVRLGDVIARLREAQRGVEAALEAQRGENALLHQNIEELEAEIVRLRDAADRVDGAAGRVDGAAARLVPNAEAIEAIGHALALAQEANRVSEERIAELEDQIDQLRPLQARLEELKAINRALRRRLELPEEEV